MIPCEKTPLVVCAMLLPAISNAGTVTVAASRVLDVASALQAIRSATLVNAELLRMQGRIGTLEPGAFADVIAVEGDPLADVRTLEHPVWIMKGGKVASDGDRR